MEPVDAGAGGPKDTKFSGLRRLIPGRGDARQVRPDAAIKIDGVVTDQRLLQEFYRRKKVDVHAIATDSFLDKSRDEYNAAWLTRELVQNFVDHNPQHPGTLDGVRFSGVPHKDGATQFRIEGDWPFADPTGVLSPHSEKPADINTAGGNGIGLKQTAIRFLRDFGVEQFEIDGEGWAVHYRLAKAAQVNGELAEMQNLDPRYRVNHDWLVADIAEARPTGKNAYIITTANPDVVQALQQLPSLGVSKENPYLQNMDYENQYGAIKWLPLSDGSVPTRGRLFINGQVMNYKGKGATAEDYWVGPENATIRLNNIKYKMSIDRPPVNQFELAQYLDPMISNMSMDDVVGQLHTSEYLWAGHIDSNFGEAEGASVIIEKLARKLPYKKGWDKENYSKEFGSKKYLSFDRAADRGQIAELQKQGYIICPSYFEQIGMPKASSKLGSLEVASNEAPKLPQHEKEKFAQEFGMEVFYEDFPEIEDPSAFLQMAASRLAPHILRLEEREERPDTARLYLKDKISKDLLFHALPKQKDDAQRLLFLLRGVVAYGLSEHVFDKIFTSQGEFLTTFDAKYDFTTEETALITRNIKNENDQGTFIEIDFNPEFTSIFREALKNASNSALAEGLQANPAGDSGEEIVGQIDISDSSDRQAGEAGPKDIGEIFPGNQKPWTAEDENLYILAISKDPAALAEDEKDLINRHKELQRQFGEVHVVQPDSPELIQHGEVIEREVKISDSEKERVAKMDENLPGLVGMVNALDKVVPKPKIEVHGKSEIEKYMEWRNSGDFYGRLGQSAGYLTGRHLVDLVNEQNQAEISTVRTVTEATPADVTRNALMQKLRSVVSRLNPEGDDVNEFEIVVGPSERQLAQLGLLKTYAELTTGMAVVNDLFIYEGTGSKGINLGQKAIGLHKGLLDVNFTEALRTFGHEIAHNYPGAKDHEVMFRHAMESVFVTMIDRVSQIAGKLNDGGSLTEQEQAILSIQSDWDTLRAA